MARMNGRGQMLLIGAIIMAIAFVSLGVVLNASLNTPSVAAEASEDVSGNELQKLHHSIQSEATEFVEHANSNYGSLSDPEGYVQSRTATLGEKLETYYARNDVALTVGPPSAINVESGTYVSEMLNSPSPATEDYSGTELRQFNIVTRNLDRGDTVKIEFSNAGTASPYTVTIDNTQVSAGGTTCPHGGAVQLTNAMTDAGPCSALSFVEEFDEQYVVTLSHSGLSGSLSYNFIREGGVSPDRVYEVNVPIEYRSPTLTFVGTFDVAPGEP